MHVSLDPERSVDTISVPAVDARLRREVRADPSWLVNREVTDLLPQTPINETTIAMAPG